MDQNHINCLHRNLASFNPVSGDSDCTIRSVIVQLAKNKEWKDQNAILMEHLAGLGLRKGLDDNVFQFHQCFMDTVQINEHYLMFSGIPLDNNDETEPIQEQRSFCGEIGDLVIKISSDILKIPIFVITSTNGCSYLSLNPEETVIGETIYIPHTTWGPGHYRCTMLTPGSNTDKGLEIYGKIPLRPTIVDSR